MIGKYGKKGMKQRHTLQRLLKQEEFRKKKGKRGKTSIDEFCYWRNIWVPLLYLFYKQVQAQNINVTVLLIGDNAPAYTYVAY